MNELKKIENDNYRKKLFDIVLNNSNLISKSYPLISFILKKLFNSNPKYICENLTEIQNNNKPYIKSISKTNNDCLNEIILIIFENQFNSYFESIPKLDKDVLKEYFYEYSENNNNATCILLDTNLELFKNCLNFLEGIYINKKENKNNELICKLYSIAYIKIYLFKCIYYNHKENQKFTKFNDVYKVIEGNGKNNFRKMVKIYIFKILYHLLNNNFQDLKNYPYMSHGIKFFDEFKEKFDKEKESMLNYYLLQIEEYNKYKEELEIFESYIEEKFNKSNEHFKEYIENNGLDIFYTISSNIIISKLPLKNYLKDSNNEYSKYSSFAKNLFDNQLKISEITKKLFLLFSSDVEFNNKIKPKITAKEDLFDIDSFEILLYGLRICLQTSNTNNPNGFLYSELLSQNAETIIKENVIPGNIFSNTFIEGYNNLKNHFRKYGSNVGAYVCSCGEYYNIAPCGFTSVSSLCKKCNSLIGNIEGEKPGNLVKRDGHYRIFKNKLEKEIEVNRYGDKDYDKKTPNMLFEEYKNKIIDPIIEKNKFGLSKISKNIFLDSGQNVRNLSFIGFRLLHFIIYLHLFYSNCLDFISNENLKEYIPDGMTCLEILVNDWNLLKDALQSKGIIIIQIFWNMLFPKICEKLKNCKEMKTTEERDKFEEDIEKLLEDSYKEYDKYSQEYLKLNREALNIDKDSMKSLMLENNEINEYDEENYPFYKFFLMTIYPSKDSFQKELKRVIKCEEKYPLLTSYISKNNNDTNHIKLLKILPEFNEFVNFMIDHYSYKISREEASNKILKDEDIYKNNEQKFKVKFEKFKKNWENLKPFAIKYGCRDEMAPIDLDENKSLAHFLNDDGEIGKGMYIAAAYQNFIDWQNQFLDGLIEPLKQNGILHDFVKNMEKKIDVQKAKKNEVLNLDEIDGLFMDIIYNNCKRNIYREDNTINYMNYKQLIYDFDAIEKIMGDIILPGKVKFNGHEKLKFVTYCYEGFRGNKSSVLCDFEDKYKQKKLSKENKQKIAKSIKDKYQNELKNLTEVLFSIQSLIYYLTQEKKNVNDTIKDIIKDLPEYINLSKDCVDFIEKQEFKVEELADVYSYIELICFKPIVDNLEKDYKKNIEEVKRKDILQLFDGNKFIIIQKQYLLTACRKLISRYLISKRKDIDYNENNKLNLYLDRQELWTENWQKETEEKIKSDLDVLGKEELILGQSYELYKLLGGDENKSLEIINKDAGKEEEKINENEEEDEFFKPRDNMNIRRGRGRTIGH